MFSFMLIRGSSLKLWVVSVIVIVLRMFVFFFKQKTAYELRISDWSSDVCSSDLYARCCGQASGEEGSARIEPPDPLVLSGGRGFAAPYDPGLKDWGFGVGVD